MLNESSIITSHKNVDVTVAGEAITDNVSTATTESTTTTLSLSSTTETPSRPSSKSTLPLSVKVLYGSPRMAMLSLTFLIQIHSVLMYEFAGAPLAFIAFFTALGRSFDTLTDPLMGWITDSTRSQYGRRRPYMVCGCVGYAISFVFFMSPPSHFSPVATSLWFGVFYIVFYTFDTITNVPYVALGPEISDDYDERNSVFFWAKVFDSFGIVFAVLGPGFMAIFVGKTWRFTALACALGLYYIITMMSVALKIGERDTSTLANQPPFIPSVLKSVTSKPFRPLLVGWILDFCALSTLSAMLPFFVTYIIRPQYPSFVLAVTIGSVFGAAILSMPVFLWASKRFGRYQTWCTFNLLNGLTCVCFVLVGEGNVVAAVIVAVLNGIPIGGNFLVDSILTDVIDYDEFLHGTRSEGAFTVFAQIIPKLVSIPAQTVPLALLGVFGFIPSINGVPQIQPRSVTLFIRCIFVGVPTSCSLLSYFIKLGFPIKSKQISTKIALGIVAHQDQRGFEDPLTGQWVLPHTFTPAETEDVMLLSSFGSKHLYRMLYEGSASQLIGRMRQQLAYSSLAAFVFMVLLSQTFDLIRTDKWSWVPSLVILFVGVSISSSIFAYMRLLTAKKVETSMIPLPRSVIKSMIETDYPSAGDDSALSPETSFHGTPNPEKNTPPEDNMQQLAGGNTNHKDTARN